MTITPDFLPNICALTNYARLAAAPNNDSLLLWKIGCKPMSSRANIATLPGWMICSKRGFISDDQAPFADYDQHSCCDPC
jgi:hypothetical protein